MKKVLVIAIPLFLTAFITFLTINYYIPETETVIVNDAVRECKGGINTDCRYVVFTNKGVYENKDTIVYFKFNSSDVHNALLGMKGKEVLIRSYGFRIPFFSAYKNIIGVAE